MSTRDDDVDNQPLVNIAPTLSFVWLDGNDKEYLKFIDKYSNLLGIDDRSWTFYDDKAFFLRMFESIKHPQEIILITSGRLATEIIEEIHPLKQLQGLFIFCRIITTYTPLAKKYHKIHGIQSDLNFLYQDIRTNLKISQSEEAGNRANFIFSDRDIRKIG